MSLITVNNLVRYYGNYRAVDDISFTLNTGDILGFLGPNGAGKSTTMKMLTGNLAPNEGEIHVRGIDLLDHPSRAKVNIGYLPEQPPLYKEMTVDEYLAYCARLHCIERRKIPMAMQQAKERCGLMQSGQRLIANLSKGYQQRVGIAQAIIHSPEIIILDEPTVGLDPNQIREIRDLIVALGVDHGIILCTHILPEVEAVCNRVQIINQGKLVYKSDMKDLSFDDSKGLHEITLLHPPAIDQIYEVAEINKVEQINPNTFVVHTRNKTAEDIVNATVANNWGLVKLVPYENTLEHVFVKFTLGDEQKNKKVKS